MILFSFLFFGCAAGGGFGDEVIDLEGAWRGFGCVFGWVLVVEMMSC